MLTETLMQEHGACDDCFARAESAADEGDLELARSAHAEFAAALRHHMSVEETVLFPAFEQQTGISNGPTSVMRMEHEQIRALLAQMEQVLAGGELDDFLGICETLNVLVQQHNMKEEQMLYPMCERELADRVDTLLERMRQ